MGVSDPGQDSLGEHQCRLLVLFARLGFGSEVDFPELEKYLCSSASLLSRCMQVVGILLGKMLISGSI
jgi:hypothetical protein